MSTRLRTVVFVAVLGAVGFGRYGPTLSIPFIADDFGVALVLGADGRPSVERMVREFSSPWGGLSQKGYYRPLIAPSTTIDVFFFGALPFGHRLHNLLLHLVNAMLVGLLLRRFGRAAGWAQWMAALLFLVHPVAVGIPAGLAERPDALATFWTLFGWLAYGRYRRGDSIWLTITAAAFVAGLLSKESAIWGPTLVAIGAACDRRSPRLRRPYGSWIVIGAMLALVAAYVAARSAALGAFVETHSPLSAWRCASGLRAIVSNALTALTWLAPAGLAAPAIMLCLLARGGPSRWCAPSHLLATALVLGAVLLIAPLFHAPPMGTHMFGMNRLLYLPMVGVVWLLFAPVGRFECPPFVHGAAGITLIVICILDAGQALEPRRIAGERTAATVSAARRISRASTPAILLPPPSETGIADSGSWFALAMRPPFSDQPIDDVFLLTEHQLRTAPPAGPWLAAAGVSAWRWHHETHSYVSIAPTDLARIASPRPKRRLSLTVEREGEHDLVMTFADRPARAKVLVLTQARAIVAWITPGPRGHARFDGHARRVLRWVHEMIGASTILVIAEAEVDGALARSDVIVVGARCGIGRSERKPTGRDARKSPTLAPHAPTHTPPSHTGSCPHTDTDSPIPRHSQK